MSYDSKYQPRDYLADYSGYIRVGLKREQVEKDYAYDKKTQSKFLEEFDRIDTFPDGELQLDEVVAEAMRDVKGMKKEARHDLYISAIPALLAALGRKNRSALTVCSLFVIAGCISAGCRFYDANRYEKDIEKFSNQSLSATA